MTRASVDRDVLGSTWGNLGLWADGETDYARAAEALARHLGEAARLEPGHHVLDVGCGYGDSLLLWRRGFGAARVLGRDVVPAQVDEARRRFSADAIECELGSATERSSLPDASVDRVLSVDAAYHFRPRAAFLREAHRVLRPGGVVAWTDLALTGPPGPLVRAALQLLGGVFEVPVQNLLPLPALEAEARDAGFGAIAAACIEDRVLTGFAAFARRHARAHLRGLPNGAWTKLLVTGRACEQSVRHRRLHYVVVTAAKLTA